MLCAGDCGTGGCPKDTTTPPALQQVGMLTVQQPGLLSGKLSGVHS